MKKEDFVEVLRKDLGSDLVCVAQYGRDGGSLVVVVESFEFNVFERAAATVKKFAKKSGSVPLFLTRETLRDGVDVFPLEFLNIKLTSKILAGENPFDSMVFRKEFVRRELEFEFRSKLISLRQGYFEVAGQRKGLRKLVSAAVPTLLPMCYGLLYVKDAAVPGGVDEIFAEITRTYEVDVDVLRAIERGEVEKSGAIELKEYVKKLMTLLADLGEILDEMKINEN